MLVVLTTTPDLDEAERLATDIVETRLAACVQILPQMTSIYSWEGKVKKENEHLLLIKTLPAKYEELEKFILTNHSYDVPEIVAVKASNVSEGYAKWLGEYLTVT
jgi:periplasmic divalent cation tolerance protein